jgi:hypothetical protein
VSRTSRSVSPEDETISGAAAQTLSTVITKAMVNWPTTMRFAVICVALSLPVAAGLALCLVIR